MSTNYKIIGKIESKKNVKRGGIMREIKEARYLHETKFKTMHRYNPADKETARKCYTRKT
jgi:hypothetical protein